MNRWCNTPYLLTPFYHRDLAIMRREQGRHDEADLADATADVLESLGPEDDGVGQGVLAGNPRSPHLGGAAQVTEALPS